MSCSPPIFRKALIFLNNIIVLLDCNVNGCLGVGKPNLLFSLSLGSMVGSPFLVAATYGILTPLIRRYWHS